MAATMLFWALLGEKGRDCMLFSQVRYLLEVILSVLCLWFRCCTCTVVGLTTRIAWAPFLRVCVCCCAWRQGYEKSSPLPSGHHSFYWGQLHHRMIRGSPCDSFSTDGHHSKCTAGEIKGSLQNNSNSCQNVIYLISIGINKRDKHKLHCIQQICYLQKIPM